MNIEHYIFYLPNVAITLNFSHFHVPMPIISIVHRPDIIYAVFKTFFRYFYHHMGTYLFMSPSKSDTFLFKLIVTYTPSTTQRQLNKHRTTSRY